MLLLFGTVLFASCESYETYGDKKAKERNAINRFISERGIKVISETVFNAQGQTTSVEDNEYVRLNNSGVYMQIQRKGCGSKLEENKTVNLLCRFMEYNIMEDSVVVANDQTYYMYNNQTGQYVDCSQYVDKMSVKRSGTTITASFIEGMMLRIHSSSSSVPSGWLVPLNYINVGRAEKEGEEIAKVSIIVPHSQGTYDATQYVYPCYYEITYEREK